MDSLLCRHPRALRDVTAVVLDELHLLDGTARGDQLRCVTTRLRHVAEADLQFCGASATLPNGETLARKYLGASAQFLQPSADVDSGPLDVDAELVDASTHGHAAEAIHEIFERGEDRKLLVFANTRSQVEDLTAKLTDFEDLRDRVHAHHGSLSRSERLRSEEKLRNAPAGICVASMTLEVGIDVGDVDRAILVGPPPNVSSLLQRIGRSNRDDEVTRVTCLHSGAFEKLRTMHLLECAAVGELFDEDLPFRPSLSAQQGLSLMFQNPDNWIAPGALYERLPPDARERWRRADCEEILDRLQADDFFHPMEGGRYTPDEEALHQFEYGELHSNIESDDEVEVVDALTRQVVGRVRFFQTHEEKLHSGEDLAVALGGEKRKVVRYEDDQLVTRSEEGTEDAQFIASLPPRYSRGLAADFAKFLGLPPQTMLLEQRGEQWLLYHFMGTVWGRILEYVLRVRGYLKKRGSRGAFFFELKKPLEQFSQEFAAPDEVESAIDDAIGSNTGKLARLLGAGPFARWIPDPIQERWVRMAVRPDQLAQTLTHSEIRTGELTDVADT
jgi:ATP-dependent Lhr-like helicase